MPFSFDLQPTVDPAAKAEFTAELFETYHGVKIDVEYSVKSEIKVSTNVSQTALRKSFTDVTTERGCSTFPVVRSCAVR